MTSVHQTEGPWRAVDLEEARRNRHLLIGGQYQLLAPLGTDGAFDRFRARQVASAGIAKRVGVKRVLKTDHRYDVARDMLYDEAQALLAIRHPGVLTLVDFVEDSEGAHLVHEPLDGATLDVAFERLRGRGVTFAHETAAYLASEVAWTLVAAHAAKDATGRSLDIVHRTLHPRHVFVTEHGGTKVTGLAYAQMRHRAQPMTNHGRLRGAPAYFAPESIAGEPGTRKTDVFGLGVILFEMLTGRECFPGATLHEALQRIVRDGPPYELLDTAEVPEEMNHIVRRATAFAPEQRFEDAEEMALALDGWLARVGGVVRPWMVARFLARAGVFDEDPMLAFAPHPAPDVEHPGPYTETIREARIADGFEDEPTQGLMQRVVDHRREESTPIYLVLESDFEAL